MNRASNAVARIQWIALALLVISVCINYIDRGNLSVAGPALRTELKLNPTELGLLFSAFFWTYALCQVLAGWLIDRYNVNWIYAGGFLLWSAATALTGLANGFTALFLLRLLLGISESVAYPSYSKIISASFPEQRRGIANGLIDAGSKLGPAFGLMIGGLIISSYGWRYLFLSIGMVSLLWLIPWCAVAPRLNTATNFRRGADAASIADILKERSAWGSFLGLFCANYTWYFLLTWLPSYLVDERHYTTRMMGLFGSLPFWGIATTSLLGGWLSDRWISRGGSPTVVRKTFTVAGLSLCTLMLPAALIDHQVLSMGLLIVACLSFGLFSSNNWAVTQTLAGPLAAGKWTGLQNGVGNLAGVAAPYITGLVVSSTGSFLLAFAVACVILLIGACSYLFLIGPIAPVRWKNQP